MCERRTEFNTKEEKNLHFVIINNVIINNKQIHKLLRKNVYLVSIHIANVKIYILKLIDI